MRGPVGLVARGTTAGQEVAHPDAGVWDLRCRDLHTDLADLQPEQLRLRPLGRGKRQEVALPAADIEKSLRRAIATKQVDGDPPPEGRREVSCR
jgi:hypothetical protein